MKNPNNGGIPARDRKFRNIKEEEKEFIWEKIVSSEDLSEKNIIGIMTDEEISEYKIKYIIQIFSEHMSEDNSHPVWRIEEYTRIFFTIIWLIAPIAPMRQEKITIILTKLFLTKIIRSIGAIFCHVRTIRVCIHLEVWITCGSQKWKGAAPILIAKAIIIIGFINEIELEELLENKIIEIKIIKIEAKAWAIKYLMEVSVE